MYDKYERDKKACVFYGIKLQKTTDADIIEAIEKAQSKQGEIKRLIRLALQQEKK